MDIILASKSPQRKKILELINIDFKIEKSNINEKKFNINHHNPKKYCSNLAIEKAKKVSIANKNALIIGSDTIVYHKNKIIGKPKNKKEALSHLKLLSDSSHDVYTSVSLISKAKKINEIIIDRTIVTFKKLSLKEINFYINNYNPEMRAGSYGIQDWSSKFIKKINGCYYNVVGFPLSKFYILFNRINRKL